MPAPIDLRSDTVTQPTLAMREAMASAAVGDDVIGDDPTVNALEERVAAIMGKEAALYTASGTMANLLAILCHTTRGDEIITHPESHVYYYESGSYAAVAGCSIRFVCVADAPKPGIITAEALRGAIRYDDVHFPRPRLVTLENTHNRGGGTVWPVETLAETADAARELGLCVHIDGARLWNAASAAGVAPAVIAEHADTVSACLSKGLGCPVGSVLTGDRATIDLARRRRKMLGGGMRQAGVLAAAGLYALDHNIDRIADDHRRARWLAGELAASPAFDLDPESIETNLLFAPLDTRFVEETGNADTWQDRLAAAGVLCFSEGPEQLRFVTHLGIDDDAITEAVRRIRGALDGALDPARVG